MKVTAEKLAQSLARGLAPVYLVSGDDPLLVNEAADTIRAAARAAGYADRSVFFIERHFDWDAVRQETQSLSLFTERRLFEFRMPGGKPDKGAAVLIDLASRPPPDTVCLVITEKLDNKTGEAPWIGAFDRAGVCVTVRPVATAALPAWLAARARALAVDIDTDAAQLICDRVEGNLLAAQQELQKLALLATERRITADLVLRSVGDSARYDVYQLGEAAAAGDAERALRVLLGLKGEGTEPTLILWALVRELRGLWQAKERLRLGANSRGSAWNVAASPSERAKARLGALPLTSLLRQAHRADRVVKGMAGGDAWTAITGLTAALAGALQAAPESG